VGYLKPEFDALGISMDDRGTKTLEYIEAMRAIWSQDKASYEGRYVRFAGVSANPKPVQAGGPPVVMGGHTPAAWRKAVTHCQGWYGFALDPEATSRNLEGLAAAAARYERPASLGRLEITVTPRGRIDVDSARQFADLGVDRLVLTGPRGTADDADALVAFVEQVGGDVIAKL